MAVASAQQQSRLGRKPVQTPQPQRTRRELLDWALKQPTMPTREMLAEFNQRFGEGTDTWLMEQLTQAQLAPLTGPESASRDVPSASAAKEDEKGKWQKPQHHLVEEKKEGFDNKAMATHGWARMQTTSSDTVTAEIKRRGKPTDGPQLKTRDKDLPEDTRAHIVESTQRAEAGKTRTTTRSKATTTIGDAAVVERLDVAAEEAKKRRKERQTQGLAKQVENHDFRVLGREKEWGKQEDAEEMRKLVSSVAGSVSGSLEGPSTTAKVGGELALGGTNGVTVAGNVSAKAVAFEGGLKYVSPTLPMAVLGEQLRAIVEVAFKAEALAEAKGGIKLKLLAKSDGLDVDVGANTGGGLTANAEAFAGLRAGVKTALKLDWLKKPELYENRAQKLLEFFQKEAGLPSGRIATYVLEDAIHLLLGDTGWVNLLKAAAGVEGSAGIGGAAAFEGAIGGGRIKFSSKLKGAIGLGFGGAASIDASLLEGLRLMAVLVANGGGMLAEDLGLSRDHILAQAKDKLLALL